MCSKLVIRIEDETKVYRNMKKDPTEVTFELDGQDSITLMLVDGFATLGLDVTGVIVGIKDQDGNDVPVNGGLITRERSFVKTSNSTLTVSVERWFVLVNHMFQFDIPQGAIVTSVHQEGSHWRFTYQGKGHTTYYGRALARETKENREKAERYWRFVEMIGILKSERDLLFDSIEKAQKRDERGDVCES